MEDETTTVDDPQADAAFGAGFGAKEVAKPVKEKPEPAPTTQVKDDPKPEYVQLTKAEADELRAAAARTTDHERQFSKAFGTIGKLQQLVNELQTNKKAELSATAFTKLKEQFPELAEMTREAVENALSGRNDPDPDALTRLLAEKTTAREIEVLEDAYPDWKTIVGAVAPGEQPDANNPFRKWLATKDEPYQKRISDSESAAVITRAITLFQKETAKPPARQQPSARDAARREVLTAAVQPKGDGAPSTNSDSLDAAFSAGFR
jgi:hypothetical protein